MAKLEIVNHSDTIGARWITPVKGCLFFPLVLFKEIIQKLIFLTDGWPGQPTKGTAKGGRHRGTTKQVLSARHYPSHIQKLSAAQWAWLNIWSTVSGLTSLAKLHLPGGKRYAFEQGNASPQDAKEVSVWCSQYSVCTNLIQSWALGFSARFKIWITEQ